MTFKTRWSLVSSGGGGSELRMMLAAIVSDEQTESSTVNRFSMDANRCHTELSSKLIFIGGVRVQLESLLDCARSIKI